MAKQKFSIGKTKKQEAKKEEQRIADLLGAKTTPNSGAMKHAKGDCLDKFFLFEIKSTSNMSYSIKTETLIKAAQQSKQMNKRFWALITTFKNTLISDVQDIVIINIDTFLELYEAWQRQQEY